MAAIGPAKKIYIIPEPIVAPIFTAPRRETSPQQLPVEPARQPQPVKVGN